MKKYLRIDEGSRGEIEGVELVETSFQEIKEDFNEFVKTLDGYVEGCAEFTFIYENKERCFIDVCFDEETGSCYVEYEKYKESIDYLLENEDDDSWLDFLDEVRGYLKANELDYDDDDDEA